jgi:hypothetical protein
MGNRLYTLFVLVVVVLFIEIIIYLISRPSISHGTTKKTKASTRANAVREVRTPKKSMGRKIGRKVR